MRVGQWLRLRNLLLVVAVLGLFPLSALAVQPVVKTVPWVATNPLIPHDTWNGKTIRLKGTTNVVGASFEYYWDFGDGTPPTPIAAVSNQYALEVQHAYTGSAGQIFTATLTVRDKTTGETGNKQYYVKIENKSLPVEVNVAIDEGLWYLHKTQSRSTSAGIDYGSWTGEPAVTASNVNAFESNGHLESGNADNPYTETVARGMKSLFTYLLSSSIGTTKSTINPVATVNPDSSVPPNGLGIYVNGTYPNYQGGMFIDAIIASGTPDKLTTTGSVNNVINRKYKDIVQDMVDFYAYSQYYDNRYGGWRYTASPYGGYDNSFNQWAAIGMIPAERAWLLTVPAWVKTANVNFLKYSQSTRADGSLGAFGYDSSYPVWGYYAVTPSGMVQMAMNGIGRGNSGANEPSWNKAETFMRTNFCNTGGAGNAVRDYYYGLFSFTKAMLLHDSNNDKVAEPIQFLAQQPGNINPIDWYSAEVSTGAPCDGVARTLVGDQSVAGNWTDHNFTAALYPFETAFALIMLNRTIFEAGQPVAVVQATPNPGVAGQAIALSGAASFHQDAAKAIVTWEWDLDNNGSFEVVGPLTSKSWPSVGDYPVTLRVTDNSSPAKTSTQTLTVRITTPPIGPTANAGGPYNFCLNKKPWFLDGTKSINPDDGQSEPSRPGDSIKKYEWDLNGGSTFADLGPTPDVTAFFTTKGIGAYLVQLKVTDNTATSFPSSGMVDLTSIKSAQVFVKAETDQACVSCISNLSARPKSGKVGLTWSKKPTAASYNVYRGTISGGPYVKIGTAVNTSLAIVSFFDNTVVNGTTYYYIVREVAASSNEYCQSNQASATPTTY